MPIDNSLKEKLSTIAYDEPFSSTTESKRRNLLFCSCLSILLSVYGLKITKTPWLDIEVPTGAPNILHGAISVGLLYTFIVFLFYSLSEFMRWRSSVEVINLNSYFDLLLKTHNFMNGVSHWVGNAPPEEKAKKESLEKFHSEAFEFTNSLESELKVIKSNYQKLSFLHMSRILILDLGLPISLGLLALYKMAEYLLPFLSLVFK